MGTLTRGTIVSEGCLIAGRDDLATRANVWLQAWLDSVAASWPWPQLKAEGQVTLTAGTPTVMVGPSSTAGVTDFIIRILDNIWAYNSTKTHRARVRIVVQESEPYNTLYDTALRQGMPEEIRIYTTSTAGQWTLQCDPTPKEAYLLSLSYLKKPAAMSSDSDIPWYPNDATMIELVASQVMKFDDGPDSPAFQAQITQVGQMLQQDRMRYGSYSGINDRMVLDASMFR